MLLKLIAVMAAACSWPMRILRIMSVSLPAMPPGKIFTSISPSEMRAQSAARPRSARSHGVLAGATLPSLMVSAVPLAVQHSARTVTSRMRRHHLPVRRCG